ncbi:MAG: bifunctional diguanylate cyclase/phosphodiesterase, partial [Loktanella sp.]|nr:bifunctional diguanylate cyclase/phosphodiesterase [Loktanella sp.]
MLLFQSLFRRTKTRLACRGPNLLCAHYCLALAILGGLVLVVVAADRRLVLAETGAESVFLHQLQWGAAGLVGLMVLAEAALAFLPDQRGLQDHLRALRDSKAELELINAQLHHTTNHDALTGLPNRQRMIWVLIQDVLHQRAAGHTFLVVGLDGFKSINDSVGHDLGDDLLVTVAVALRSCVDEDDDIARIDGDEFALRTNEPADHLIRRVTAAFADPFEVQGRSLKVKASIGYLTLGPDEKDALAIFADADLALQTAKNTGGHRAQRFVPALREQSRHLQALQLELPDAIRNGELEPWFQPQMRLTDGGLHGVEVLARWRHPTQGMLTPDRFLLAAERAGLMVELDHAIWLSAMRQAMIWQEANLWRPVISLNAAPDTIADPYLIEKFLLSLRRSGLSVDQVIVEVLETTLISGAGDMAAINIDGLSECGIGLELDDFGTGYASLSRLTQLPLSGIKLDRSLIAPLPEQGADSVVRAILALATELGLHVVAEGVED